jgi:transcriptional regulator of heat shock response
MIDETDSSQSIYVSKDVATMKKIQESTLRKYCIMLEDQGYHFHKNDHGHRGFMDNDVITLRKLIEIKSHPDMTLKQACNAIMTWVKEKNTSEVDTNVITKNEQYNKQYNELKKEMIQQQNEMLKKLAMKMDEQQRCIDERLERRDQQLMSAIRKMQEEKRVLLETAATNKKPWWRFW